MAGTAIYTFTPTAGQCATTTTLSITVDAQAVPTFAAVGNICQNSAAPTLPASSTNGITGTWNPATVSTAVAGTAVYTFTPTAGQCATTTTLSITVDAPQIIPIFTAIGPLCQNSAAPALPAISNNGISGTWNPAAISTASTGTTTYTFTPDAGQCATSTTLDVTIADQVTPAFTAIGPLCENSVAPALPATSNNGITGTWSPAVINTATVGTTTYSFTPDVAQCGTATSMDITIVSQITPVFTAIGPLCEKSVAPALPATSNNGITGTWSPASISTVSSGTTTYTFTPDPGQCDLNYSGSDC